MILLGLYKSSIIFEILLLALAFLIHLVLMFNGCDNLIGYEKLMCILLYTLVSGLITLQVFLGCT